MNFRGFTILKCNTFACGPYPTNRIGEQMDCIRTHVCVVYVRFQPNKSTLNEKVINFVLPLNRGLENKTLTHSFFLFATQFFLFLYAYTKNVCF